MKKYLIVGTCTLFFLFFSYCNTRDKVKKIMFFGDSITNFGSKKNGYITIIDSLIQIDGKKNQFQTMSSGVNGDKITDLYLRYEEDVLSKHPDYVVIFIGINDIYKKDFGAGTDSKTFAKFFSALTKKLEEASCKLIICSPTGILENMDSSNKYNRELNDYADWFKSYCFSHNTPLINTREAFINYEKTYNKENKKYGILTSDGIHLTDKGNKLVATEIWKELKAL